jgi:hypothetical protein
LNNQQPASAGPFSGGLSSGGFALPSPRRGDWRGLIVPPTSLRMVVNTAAISSSGSVPYAGIAPL